MLKRDWILVYTVFPDQFKAKCPMEDFAAFMPFVLNFDDMTEDVAAVLDEARFVVEETWVDGSRGWVKGRVEFVGGGITMGIELGNKSADEAPSFIWEDGKWMFFFPPEAFAAVDNPCSLDSGSESSPTITPPVEAEPTATPQPVVVSVPPTGLTVDDPLPAGAVLRGSDGTEIRVLEIVGNTHRLIANENQYIYDPPKEGNRFYMILAEVSNPSGADSIEVLGYDFKLIGDSRVAYNTLENSCGFNLIPDELSGEIYGGGRIQGNICFQIPSGESGLILIHGPGYGAESRRFLSLH